MYFTNLTGLEWGENKPEDVKLFPGWGGSGRTQPTGLGVGVGDRNWRLGWEELYGSCSTLGRNRKQRTDIKAHTMVHTLGVLALCLFLHLQTHPLPADTPSLRWPGVPTICHSQAGHMGRTNMRPPGLCLKYVLRNKQTKKKLFLCPGRVKQDTQGIVSEPLENPITSSCHCCLLPC